jgi:hypothetical protein
MSELKVNKVSPQSGTDFTLGDSGDTFTVPSGATLTVAGTFTQTGAQTFDGGVDIDNFNINGTTITLSSGDMTLDVAGDIILDADGGDVFVKDAGTTFGSLTNTSGNLIIKSGTTTAATFSGANVTLAGTVGSGAITSTGIVTGTAFTAGNAVLAEAELELLDGLTAGTAIASKVVTTDANIDTTGQRNLTITGELDAATGDFSGAVDVAGALTSSATATITVAGNSDVLILKSTDADANVGPILSLHRDSANPADNDITGRINFRADNDAGEAIDYASMFCKLADVTDGTEDFKLIIQGKKAGTDVNILQIGEDEVIINEDSNDVNFRVESNGQSHMLFVDAGNDRIGILDSAPGHTLESGNSDSGKGWSLANENNVYKIRSRSDASDTQTHIQFENTNNIVGTIKTNGTATQFNTSSDYRLKENVSYNFDATTRLKQLKPARFNFISDSDTTLDGFIAHEVSSIVPEAVSGDKDATKTLENVILNADGSFFKQNISQADWIMHKAKGTFANDTTWVATHTMPEYQGIDQSKLVPLLIKTIQELEARIKTLEDA